MKKILRLGFVLLFFCSASTLFAKEGYPERCVDTAFSKGDGKIVLLNYHFHELLDVTYRKGCKYNQNVLKDIQHLFRSRAKGEEYKVDVRLIELLDSIQDHFKIDTIELISGYRTPELNKILSNKTDNVAEESYHTKGQAADIHIDSVTEEAVREYVLGLKAGGIGYYPALDFVHVDTGFVRSWDMPDKPGRSYIAFRKGVRWQVTTDRDIYLPGDKIKYEMLNVTRVPCQFEVDIELQLYNKGEWQNVKRLSSLSANVQAGRALEAVWEPDIDARFGKYRIVILDPQNSPHLYPLSNEFYRKLK